MCCSFLKTPYAIAVDRPVCCALQHKALPLFLVFRCVPWRPRFFQCAFPCSTLPVFPAPSHYIDIFCKTLCLEISCLLVLSLITILSKRQRRIKQHLVAFAPSLVCFDLTTLIPWHSLFLLRRSLHLLIYELPNPLSSARLWPYFSGDSRKGRHHHALSNMDLELSYLACTASLLH